MTQAFNLSQLANKVNSSGQLDVATGVTGTQAVANGGTGQSTYTNGQLLIGNTTGNTLTKATLTAGSGITVTNGTGSITIAATGGGGFSNMQVFASPGTFTTPASTTNIKVTVVGGGGGGRAGNGPVPGAANGEQVYDEGRIAKAVAAYGQNRVYVAQQISAGIPLDQIIANAQNPEQKQIAAEASKPGGDPLLDEAVAKVNAAKYSFGRDVANFFLPKDLEGKSGLYTWISGTGDAAFRIFLDPTIVLGKVAKAVNAGKFALTKTIGSAAKVDNAHTVELSRAVSVSFNGSHNSVLCTLGQFLAVCKKHSTVVRGNSSCIPGVPLLTKVGFHNFYIQLNFNTGLTNHST